MNTNSTLVSISDIFFWLTPFSVKQETKTTSVDCSPIKGGYSCAFLLPCDSDRHHGFAWRLTSTFIFGAVRIVGPYDTTHVMVTILYGGWRQMSWMLYFQGEMRSMISFFCFFFLKIHSMVHWWDSQVCQHYIFFWEIFILHVLRIISGLPRSFSIVLL